MKNKIILVLNLLLITTTIYGQHLNLKSKKGKIGIRLNKKLLIDYKYDSAEKLKDNEFIVTKDGKLGFVGENGNLILECLYDDLKVVYGLSKRRFKIKKDDKYGVIDRDSRVVVPIEHEIMLGVKENTVIIRHENSWKELLIGSSEYTSDNVIFNVVEEMPLYGQCTKLFKEKDKQKECSNSEMLNFIYKEIKYPKSAIEQKVEGVIVIRMIINENGEIENPEIVRDIGAGCGAEGLRVVKLMPKWNPGIMNGYKSSVYFNLPIKFRLK